jgi:hypothetical protein
MLRIAMKQFGLAYPDAGPKTVDELSASESAAFFRLTTVASSLLRLDDVKSAAGLYAVTRSTRDRLKLLLETLGAKDPIYYGCYLNLGDTNVSLIAFDAEVFGYRLSDSASAGDVASADLNGVMLPKSSLVSSDGGFFISIPSPMREVLRSQYDPCAEPKRFTLTVHLQGGSAPHDFVDTVTLGSERVFVAMEAAGGVVVSQEQVVTFAVDSAAVTSMCGQVGQTSVSFPLPPNASLLQYAARWVDPINVSQVAAQQAVRDGVIIAGGSFTTDWARTSMPFFTDIRICAGPGRATLRLEGSYKAVGEVNAPRVHKTTAVLEDETINFTLPSETGLSYDSVSLSFSKLYCNKELDSLDLSIKGAASASGASKAGAFEATFNRNIVSVKRIIDAASR